MSLPNNEKVDGAHLRAGYVPLKEYADARFEAICRALDKAEDTLAARLASMNEFRDQLKDQAAKFITREEVSLMLGPVCDDIRIVRDFMTRQEGKASQSSVLLALAIAVAGLVLGALKFFMN